MNESLSELPAWLTQAGLAGVSETAIVSVFCDRCVAAGIPLGRADLTAGMTDYVAITTRFAAEGVIGEMDAVYSSWGTKASEGFNDNQIATLKRLVPHLALAIKS